MRIDGNRLLCGDVDCTRPTAAYELLSEPMGTDHIVVLDKRAGYSVRHPIFERLDGALLHCFVGRILGEFADQYVKGFGITSVAIPVGVEHRVWVEGEGEDADLVWEPM